MATMSVGIDRRVGTRARSRQVVDRLRHGDIARRRRPAQVGIIADAGAGRELAHRGLEGGSNEIDSIDTGQVTRNDSEAEASIVPPALAVSDPGT